MNEVAEKSALLTVEQVAEILSVPKSWVYRQADAGKFPHVRVGRYIRFRPFEVQQWIDEGGSEC